MKKWIYRVLVIAWMIVIFTFSAKDATDSAADSSRIGYALAHVLHADFDSWDAADQVAYVDSIDFYIRKGAHMTEYAILGFLIMGALGNRFFLKYRSIHAWILGVLYAWSDEYHQTFVPGRSGEARDVCIDATGVLIGVLIFVFIVIVILKQKEE